MECRSVDNSEFRIINKVEILRYALMTKESGDLPRGERCPKGVGATYK